MPRVELAGPPGGPPILFLHGAVMSRAQWRPQLVALAAAGYRCIAIDLPGHGEMADRAFRLEEAADVVVEAIDGFGGGRAILVGLSLGGYVAMTVAARSPERVRGLVLAGATREPVGAIRAGFAAVAWTLRLAPETVLRSAMTALYRRRYGREVAADILANGYFARGGSLAIRELGGGGFRDRLRSYGGPILVINGDLDLVFRLGERGFIAGLPQVSTERLRRAAHLSNVDRPEAFSAAVRAFAERLEP
jgi:pimeloyl-ACP methyl ester carboxylesterase